MARGDPLAAGTGISMLLGRMSWVAGLVLALSSFMGWYSGDSVEGPRLSVLGWNTGSLGKLVFVVGVAAVAVLVARELGVILPRSLPEGLVLVILGTLGVIFVLIRIVSIPDALAGTADRGVGLWIALAAAAAMIASGVARLHEEL